MSQRIVVIDSQRLSTMQLCARKYNFAFLQELQPHTMPHYIEKGDLMHRMLQSYYTLRKYRSRWNQNKQSHANIVDICVKIGQFHSAKLKIDCEAIEWCIETFKQYCTHYHSDGWDQIRFIEQTASNILYESSDLIILYEGKIDLALDVKGLPILPIDHKTASQRHTPHELSNQFIGYCWLLNCNMILVNVIGYQTTLKPFEKFQRFPISYSPDIINEWKDSAIWWIRHMLELADQDYFPPNFTSCDKWGGCTYQEVCKSVRDVRDWKLGTLFEKRTTQWDVGVNL